MTLEQIAKVLNENIVPNYLGENVTISTDLSNIVDVGTAIADLDEYATQNFARTFIAGVARTYFETRKYKAETYALMNDAREYGGVVQRVKSKLLTVEDTPIWTLQNGQDYFDGTYHGIETDVKVYSIDDAFRITYSIPNEEFKQYFTNADSVMNLVAMITSTVDNTLATNLNALARTTLQQLIATASADNREIALVTTFNTIFGLTGDNALTEETALHNTAFLRWAAEQIIRIRDYVTDMNEKYNDGTVPTFTPREDTRTILLSEFATALTFNMESDTFHNDLVSIGEYNKINFWQNASGDMLPSLGVTAEVKTHVGEGDPVTVENVIGCIFDKYSAGVTARLDKVTANYIGGGDFTNYYHHVANSRFVDTRNTGIILTLN